MLAWAIGCSLAALAGILMAPVLTLDHTVLTLLVVNAYAAAMLGRLRSLPLTFLGALILGLAEAYATGYLPTGNQYITGLTPGDPGHPAVHRADPVPQRPAPRSDGHRAPVRSCPGCRGERTFLGCAVLIAGAAVVAHVRQPPERPDLAGSCSASVWSRLSLVPLIGYAGQISLCQMSFAGHRRDRR